ncbi:MAG: hypothetical protein U9P44_00235 [archaeon]|nr:hypothetical protein [archaeon]
MNNKTVEGCLAEFAVDLVIGYLFLDSSVVVITIALAATIIEAVTEKPDDNLLIPVFSGFCGQAVVFVLMFLGARQFR